MNASRFEVPVEKLRWRCDVGCFTFQCTDELEPLQEFIGQDRAVSAIEFGLGVDQPGYNIFVTGMSGTGKSSVVQSHLQELVRQRKERGEAPVPTDWCYIHNFDDTDRPEILQLPAGLGRKLKRSLERLLEDLRREVATSFGGEEYESQRKAVAGESQTQQRELFQALDQEARTQGFTVQISPAGVAIVPITAEGKPVTSEDFGRMSDEQKKNLEARRTALLAKVEETVDKARELDRVASERLVELNRRVAEFATGGVFQRVRKDFSESPQIVSYLEALQRFAVDSVDVLREPDGETASSLALNPVQQASQAARERAVELPFAINVFVDNTGADSPPIIVENNPTFGNLFGKIDRTFVFGGYVTNHTMLKPGSIQQANGGYLVLNMRNVITNPMVWETLKRVIRTKEVRLEDPAEAMGFMVPQVIKPAPLPLHLKVVVTGDASLYNLLATHDDEFWETFKVKADFDSEISHTTDHLNAYAAFICRTCHDHNLRHFEPSSVGRVVEYASRLVADQRKLSTRFGLLRDVIIEADYWARRENHGRVTAEDVDKAMEQKHFRSNLVSERLNDMIADGSILVDVAGESVGQINGLAVYSGGDVAFGKPSRITARTFLGRGGVINIEREAKLSGSTHDKGVLILAGYLGSRYAQERPLAVSVSLAFEQSYAGVDGDSASSTEMYATLSSLADAPIKQGFAVTGSMNQKGEIQPIGGVNEKIEGFFDVCKSMGLTGEQGVLIPKQNVTNLMLRQDVVDAISGGKFRVCAVGDIDEGIELLTSIAAGVKGEDGKYPEGTINDRVEKRLQAYAEAQRAFAGRSDNGSGSDTKTAEGDSPSNSALDRATHSSRH